jgi:hypothetical protein
MNKLKLIRKSYYFLTINTNYKYSTSGHLFNKSRYEIEYEKSIKEPEKYWQSKVDLIEWIQKPKLILDKSNSPFEKWYLFVCSYYILDIFKNVINFFKGL